MADINEDTQVALTLDFPPPTSSMFAPNMLGSKVRVRGRCNPLQEVTVEGNVTRYPRADGAGNWSQEFDFSGFSQSYLEISAYLAGDFPSRLISHCFLQPYSTRPSITRLVPTSPGYVPGASIRVEGRGGITGSQLTVWEGNQSLGTAVPEISGVWATNITPRGIGNVSLTVNQIDIGGTPERSDPYVIIVAGAPDIVPVEAVQDMTFTLTVENGGPHFNVEIFYDLGSEIVASGVFGSNGRWTGQVTVLPGSVSLVARQTQGTWASERGLSRRFKIRPPKQTIVNVEMLPNQTAKFSGTGYNGATLVLSYISGPINKPLPEVIVANGVWQVSATGWTNGVYTYSAIQKVPDNAGGWIPSQDFQFQFTVSSQVPDPTNVRVSADYTPTFSGNGVSGATVLIRKQNGAEAAPDAVVVNGSWSSVSRQVWGPTFSETVLVKQRLDGQESAPGVPVVVKIPPLAPVITYLEEGTLSPFFAGTCWRGASVKLVFSDSPTVHSISSQGQWQFRRATPFDPGVTYTVTVTQDAAEQTSPPTSRTFQVGLVLLKPVITVPVTDEVVERDLTVRGTNGTSGASMQIRVDGINVQAKRLTVGGLWYVNINGLAFGRRILDAQQTLDNRPSERSDPVVVHVVLMPPVFTVPQPGGDLPRTSTISGEGMPGARVEVWLEGRDDFLLQGVLVNASGRWEGGVTLPVGVTNLRARQAIESVVSDDSPLMTCNVVPVAPYIETPVREGHIGRSTVVSGFGVPGDMITILLGDVRLGSTQVQEDRSWSVPVLLTQPGGNHVLVAVASYDGFESDRSAAQPVVLGSYLPTIDRPQAGRWVSDPVGFSGQGRAGTGQLVSWFNPERSWAPNLAVSAQGWQGAAVAALPAGGNWCRFKQTIVDGADASTISDWSESGRFEVLGPQQR